MGDIPSGEFDVCILGESLINHFIAAKLSINISSLIVLEEMQMNRTIFGTHNFDDFLKLIDSIKDNNNDIFNITTEPKIENRIEISPESVIEASSRASLDPNSVSVSDLILLSNKFNIEFLPLIINTSGDIIDNLIDFDITNHINVIAPTFYKIFDFETNQFQSIPFSKNDVFISTYLHLKEKRIFTRFVNYILEPSLDEQQNNNIPLSQLYQDFSIDEKLERILKYSIIQDWTPIQCDVTTKSAFIHKLAKTLESMQRFSSNSKYIMSYNGSVDLIHAFLRKSCVMGGSSAYGSKIQSIEYIENEDTYKINLTNNSHISAKSLIMDRRYASLLHKQENLSIRLNQKSILISHCIMITTKPSQTSMDSLKVCKNDKLDFEFLVIPAAGSVSEDVFVIKFGSASLCPIGLNLVYLYQLKPSIDPKNDLQSTVTLYTSIMNVKPIWKCYYTSRHCSIDQRLQKLDCDLPRIFITDSMCGSLIADHIIPILDDDFVQTFPSTITT